jgi:hypothetical protein
MAGHLEPLGLPRQPETAELPMLLYSLPETWARGGGCVRALDGWRSPNRTLIYWRRAGSSVRLMTAPHVHIIQTRSASSPVSSSPQYSCSRNERPRGPEPRGGGHGFVGLISMPRRLCDADGVLTTSTRSSFNRASTAFFFSFFRCLLFMSSAPRAALAGAG